VSRESHPKTATEVLQETHSVEVRTSFIRANASSDARTGRIKTAVPRDTHFNFQPEARYESARRAQTMNRHPVSEYIRQGIGAYPITRARRTKGKGGADERCGTNGTNPWRPGSARRSGEALGKSSKPLQSEKKKNSIEAQRTKRGRGDKKKPSETAEALSRRQAKQLHNALWHNGHGSEYAAPHQTIGKKKKHCDEGGARRSWSKKRAEEKRN